MTAIKRKAFTLIELLVVVLILTILAGMLLPVLSASREKARRTNCMGNLKQIGTACLTYADDWNGWFPVTPDNVDTYCNPNGIPVLSIQFEYYGTFGDWEFSPSPYHAKKGLWHSEQFDVSRKVSEGYNIWYAFDENPDVARIRRGLQFNRNIDPGEYLSEGEWNSLPDQVDDSTGGNFEPLGLANYVESPSKMWECPSADVKLNAVDDSNYTYTGSDKRAGSIEFPNASSLGKDISTNHADWLNTVYADGHASGAEN